MEPFTEWKEKTKIELEIIEQEVRDFCRTDNPTEMFACLQRFSGYLARLAKLIADSEGYLLEAQKPVFEQYEELSPTKLALVLKLKCSDQQYYFTLIKALNENLLQICSNTQSQLAYERKLYQHAGH